jgi:hypothetical protein
MRILTVKYREPWRDTRQGSLLLFQFIFKGCNMALSADIYRSAATGTMIVLGRLLCCRRGFGIGVPLKFAVLNVAFVIKGQLVTAFGAGVSDDKEEEKGHGTREDRL